MTLRARCSPGWSSFTLVELLVAVAVLSLLLAALAQIIGIINGSWLIGRQHLDNLLKGRAAVDLISRDLARGVFRADLPAFVDQNGLQSPDSTNYYAFYSGGLGTGVRAISLIHYYEATTATNSILERGEGPVAYTDSIPFGTSSLSELTQLENTAADYQQIATGVVAFRLVFYHNVGQYYSLNYLDNATNRASAITCTLAVLDEISQQVLAQQGKLSSFINSSAFTVPSNPQVGLKYSWEQNLNAAGFFNNYPKRVATGVKIFERVLYLPLVSPSATNYVQP